MTNSRGNAQEPQMRILYINLSPTFGGGPEHLYQLVKGAASYDVQPFIATPFSSPYMEQYSKLTGQGHMLDMPGRRFSLLFLFRLVGFARKNKVNLLHSHGKGAGLYSRLVSMLTGIKCVHTFHGLHMKYPFLLKCVYIKLERFLSCFTACCIAVSPSEFKAVLNKKLAPAKRLTMICNGVPIPDKEPAPITGKPFKIIQISRFDVAKNSELLLDIALILRCKNRLQEVKFIFLGEGENLAGIKERVAAEGLEDNFSFIGFSKTPRLFLKESHCYLSTSLWEGMPLALLEAMSEGLPVIASDVIGNKDAVLDGETGFLFPLDAPQAAAEQIISLLEQPQQGRNMGLAGFRRVKENFSVDKMVAETTGLYRKILTVAGA